MFQSRNDSKSKCNGKSLVDMHMERAGNTPSQFLHIHVPLIHAHTCCGRNGPKESICKYKATGKPCVTHIIAKASF